MRRLRGQKENTASPIIECWTVFTELLPGNALIKSVTVTIISVVQNNSSETFNKQQVKST
jgi:hypothetical protein